MITARQTLILGCLAIVLASSVPGALAFGAGNIPAYSAAAKTAYRHGTIAEVLGTLAATASHGRPDAGHIIKGIAGALFSGNAEGLGDVVKHGGGGSKFSGLDIKRVYFGNWLRDYSQAMDIAGLSKINGDTILLLVMALGFMAFGYATEEFEVTKEKLGVYLCTEHIDNPKGYAADQPNEDARPFDSRLRPPVDNRELEIDQRNGMKKYIASDGEGFDTSTACIRRHLEKCIELGRRGGEQDRHEAYRELGTALHTLEDFLAHSNYLELALHKLGHEDVFCHVGDRVRIRAPSGESVPPIVTGTFGSADFFASLLGEVGDKLGSATVDDLNTKFNDAKTQEQDNNNSIKLVQNFMTKLPSENQNDGNVQQQLDNVEKIRKNAININPDDLAPEELQQTFLEVLRTRDNIFKSIETTLERLGLDDLIEELSNALSVLVLTSVEPYILPVIKKASDGISSGSSLILQREDQLLVFKDDNASDPTHSVLSKDHFETYLNHPAGLTAVEVVKHTVPLVVEAWSDRNADVNQIINTILEAIHHPYFARDGSAVQRQMLDTVRRWLGGLPSDEQQTILRGLTKESVKEGKNKREDAESYGTLGHRCSGHGQPGHSHALEQGAASAVSGFGARPGRQQQQHVQQPHQQSGTVGGRYEDRQQTYQQPQGRPHQVSSGYGGGENYSGQSGEYGQSQEGRYGQQQHSSYGNEERTSYGSPSEERTSYGQSSEERTGYGRQAEERTGYGRQSDERTGYGRQSDNIPVYGGRQTEGRQESHGYGRNDNDSYGSRRQDDEPSYSSGSRYGSGQDDESSYGQSHSGGYGRAEEQTSYGRRHEQEPRQQSGYGSSYGNNEQSSYGGSSRTESRYGEDSSAGGGYGRSSYGQEQSSDSYGERRQHDSGGRHQGQGEERRGGRHGDYEDPSSRMGRMDLNDDGEGLGYGGGRGGRHHQQEERSGYGGNDSEPYGERRSGYGEDQNRGYGY